MRRERKKDFLERESDIKREKIVKEGREKEEWWGAGGKSAKDKEKGGERGGKSEETLKEKNRKRG